jgi:hypothetical protein
MLEIPALPHLLEPGVMFRWEEQEALVLRAQGQPKLHFPSLVVVMKMLVRIVRLVRLGQGLVATDFH